METDATLADARSSIYRFGDLTLDLRTRKLRRGTDAIELTKLTYELLRVLVEASPGTVPRDEMINRVWGPRRIVTPENLAQRLLALRRALGDDATHPRYVEAIRGYGYRLIPGAERIDGNSPSAPRPEVQRRPAAERASGARRVDLRPALWTALAATAILTVGYVLMKSGCAREIGAAESGAASAPAAPVDAPHAARPGVLPNSVAVLPFKSIGSGLEAADFASGIHVEIIHQLGKLDGVNVIARTSVQRYAQASLSIREIAAELNVQTVLEGSVRFDGDRWRVWAQLNDPETNARVWSETYERDAPAAFEAQTDIAASVVNGLIGALSLSGQPSPEIGSPPVPAAAYAFYLQALRSMPQFSLTIEYLDRALGLEPGYAQANSLKAMIVAFSLINSFRRAELGITAANQQQFESLALQHAERALAGDPNAGMAWMARALLHQYRWRWQEAREACLRALDVSPNDPRVLALCARILVTSGRDDEAMRLARRALDLDPNSAETNFQFGLVARLVGRPDLAIDAYRTAIRLSPASILYNATLGNAYSQAGKAEEAERQYRMTEELMRERAGAPVLPFLSYGYAQLGLVDDAKRLFRQIESSSSDLAIGVGGWAIAYLAVGDSERALEQLALAVEKARAHEPDAGFFSLMFIKENLYDDEVLKEPRFQALLSRLGPPADAPAGG